MNDDDRAAAARSLLRAALQQFGGPFSQAQLADVLGISQGMVSKMAAGAGISPATIRGLASFYGMARDEMDATLERIAGGDDAALMAEFGALAVRRSKDHHVAPGQRADSTSDVDPRGGAGRRKGPSVLSVPAFTVRTIASADVARDALGQLWIDPRAGTGPGDAAIDADGDDRLRIERFSDGTVRLDEAQVRDRRRSLGIPEERHSLLVTDELDVPRRALRRVYLSTVLELLREGSPIRRYSARPPTAADEEADRRPLEKSFVSGLPEGASSLVVLTADNPRGRRLLTSEVDARMHELRSILEDEVGHADDSPTSGQRVWDVMARSPEGVAAWHEPSFGVCDLSVERARQLAQEYGQIAFFVITGDELQLHWTATG